MCVRLTSATLTPAPGGAGHRQRHERLGPAPEIDRPVVDLVGDRGLEFVLRRKVDVAADPVHGLARNAQLFAPLVVEQRQLGDRRHLTQQPEAVELALLGARRPQDRWVVQPSWPSISLMNWVIFEAAELACSLWMRTSAARCSRTVNQISTRLLVMSAVLMTATNSATYFQNSVRRAISRPRHGTLPNVNLFSQPITRPPRATLADHPT